MIEPTFEEAWQDLKYEFYEALKPTIEVILNILNKILGWFK